MNKLISILGVIILAGGVATAAYFWSIGQGMRLRSVGSEGVAIVGVLLLIGGIMMKSHGTAAQGFKCSKCGASFASDMALKSHLKDKHGM